MEEAQDVVNGRDDDYVRACFSFIFLLLFCHCLEGVDLHKLVHCSLVKCYHNDRKYKGVAELYVMWK